VQVVYTKTFLRDLAKVVPLKRREQIEKFVFERLPALYSIEAAGIIEKMLGHKNHYKVRFGNYRVGMIKNRNQVELLRVMDRKDIYKFFP
jgi:mRNA interferase RelE/StbE